MFHTPQSIMDSKGKTSSLPSTLTKSSISYQFKSRLTSPRLIHSRSPPSLSNPSIQISQPIKIGRQPIECYCPCCRQNIVTDTESVPGFLTCLMAGLFCATGQVSKISHLSLFNSNNNCILWKKNSKQLDFGVVAAFLAVSILVR